MMKKIYSVLIALVMLLGYSGISHALTTEFNYELASLSEAELLVDWTGIGTSVRTGKVISSVGNTRTYLRNDIPIGGGQAWMFEAVMSADQITGAGERGARMWARFTDLGAPAFPLGDKSRHVELRLLENAALERRFVLFDALGGGEMLSITGDWAYSHRVRLRRQLIGIDDLIFLEAQLASASPGAWTSVSTLVSGLSHQVATASEFGFGNHSTPSGDFDSQWSTIRLMASDDADTLLPTVVPEPSTYLLLGSGMLGLAFWRRRRLKG